MCVMCVIEFMLLLFFYTDKEMKTSDQNMLLEMSKMEINPITMYSLGQYQLLSRNFNKMESVNFNQTEIQKEDSIENIATNNSKDRGNKAKADVEKKIKNDQENKVDNVSIVHLI